ncbi:MAG: MOSC domain-containing protein [Clostridiales bacterium]|nr:MOSC domain-containing protein [Clostridiales bacterium]
MGTVLHICISTKRGTPKQETDSAKLIPGWGIDGDAHAGNWHRQVSLLSSEKIREFQNRGASVKPGDFGENLVTEGYDLRALPVGTRFRIGDALLEMTQIGKECHTHCQIYQTMGDCIMPREGVFAEVVSGGLIRKGDTIEMIAPDKNRPFTAAVITLSDKGAAGEREDKSGPAIVKLLCADGYDVKETILLPDERPLLEKELIRLADQRQVDVIFTTGGTGFAERDVTPEATIAVCNRMANGIAEAIRNYSMTITPRAMLSRAVSGIRGKTLIINLPGSPKAVTEALEFLLPSLEHGLGILRGTEGECARRQ